MGFVELDESEMGERGFVDPFLDEDVVTYVGSDGGSYEVQLATGSCNLENPEVCESCE